MEVLLFKRRGCGCKVGKINRWLLWCLGSVFKERKMWNDFWDCKVFFIV